MMEVPAKTFFLGEYLALFGGPACIALTREGFHIDKQRRLHPECMAARFWLAQTGSVCDWGLQDPYQGRGGLGASSAEFLLAYRQIFSGPIEYQHLHQVFCQYADVGQGLSPSGYDVLAQTCESMVIIESNPWCFKENSWRFDEVDFILVHTGKKLKTHEHLHGLKTMPWQCLMSPVEQGCEAIQLQLSEQFLRSISDCYQQLLQLGLVAKHTQFLIQSWVQQFPILAAKGCGAMGADVVALLILKEKLDEVVEKIQEQGFLVLATSRNLYFSGTKT